RPKRGSVEAAAARNRRFARLRSTAPPTFRLAVNPTRATPALAKAVGVAQVSKVRPGRALRRPFCARRESARGCMDVRAILAEASGLAAVSAWPVRPKASCGPEPAAVRALDGPFWSPCVCGNRGAACGQVCSADRCASRLDLRNTGVARKSRASTGGGTGCQPEGREPEGWLASRSGDAQCLNQLILAIATWLTPLSAITKPVPSLVGIMLRITPPPEGSSGKVWNVSVLGSNRTNPLGLVLPSSYHTTSWSTVMP